MTVIENFTSKSKTLNEIIQAIKTSQNRTFTATRRTNKGSNLMAINIQRNITDGAFLLEHKVSGPVNLTSPNPVTNQEFTSALARAMDRPALFPAPAIALKIALGGFSSEVLGSKKVIPQALIDAGFTWDYPHITNALNALIQE